MERLAGITIDRLTDLAGRLFFDTVPTLSAIGPVGAAGADGRYRHVLVSANRRPPEQRDG